MSYIHPNIDTRHIVERAVNSKGLGTLSREEDKLAILKMTPEQYRELLKKEAVGAKRPQNWRAVDEELTKLGSMVTYTESGKRVSRYDSLYAQSKINSRQLRVRQEKTLLTGVDEIAETLDLKGTTIDSLGTIKKVGGALYLDTKSAIKDLSSLKEVGGSVVVYGKSNAEIKNFLEKANFPFEELGKKVRSVIKFL